jgi:hypothetical protein
VIGVYFAIHNKPLSVAPEFILMRWLRLGPVDGLRMGASNQRNQVIRGLEHSDSPNDLWEVGGGSWRLGCTKALAQWDSASFQIKEHMQVLEGWYAWRRYIPCPLPPIPCPMQLFHLAVPKLNHL